MSALAPALSATTHRFPAGFRGAVAAAGIKAAIGSANAKPRNDMALIVCPEGAAAAGMFTRNVVCAAPLQVTKRHLTMSRGHASALLINSGCANAATGTRGEANALECADAVAGALDVAPESILLNSTGVIGVQLPIECMLPRIPEMAADLTEGSLAPIAEAIMTTDTRPKSAAVEVEHEGRRCLVSGVAKGAGMIHPDLDLAGELAGPPQATMISVLMTDAELDPQALARILRRAVDQSFHRISIDGDTSTNDSVFALASGKAGLFPETKLLTAFCTLSRELSLQILHDGEGYERGIHVRVTGARTKEDALHVARTIATSLLVRCAVTGGDPNWGRILAAAGRAGVHFRLEEVRLTVGGIDLFTRGAPAETPLAERERVFREPLIVMELDLGQGAASEEFFSCGLTEGYVRLNAEYMT